MPLRRLALAFAILPVLAAAAAAQDKTYPMEPLLSTGTTVMGEPIHYPRHGAAHINAAIVVLAPGGRTIVHKHGVPLFAYILEGELTVDYGAHGKRTYRKGESFMEAMNVAHFGVNTGTQPVRLLAVYMGAKGARDVVPVVEPGAKAARPRHGSRRRRLR
jgi:quercetin dioxygenase-like cupin family protein